MYVETFETMARLERAFCFLEMRFSNQHDVPVTVSLQHTLEKRLEAIE